MFSYHSPFVNWPSVRQKRRRYSVNASLYWTLLVFIAIGTVNWALGTWKQDGPIAQDAASIQHLLKRDGEPEVLPIVTAW